jgi:hypothetical protein
MFHLSAVHAGLSEKILFGAALNTSHTAERAEIFNGSHRSAARMMFAICSPFSAPLRGPKHR